MISYFRAGTTIPLSLKLYDGNADQYPTAYVRTASGLFESVNLPHSIGGLYLEESSVIPQSPFAVVQYRVYEDAGRTTYSTEYGAAVEIFVNNDSLVPVACQIDSLDETKFVRAKVYQKTGSLIGTYNVPHVAAGLHLTAISMPSGQNMIIVELEVFDDAGFSVSSQDHGSTQYVYGYHLLAAIDVRDGLIGGI